LLDLASVLGERDLSYALDRAERLQLFDLTSVEEVLDRARGRRGAKILRNALSAWRPADVRNDFEARLHELVRNIGRSPPQANVLVQGERYTHEVDAYWPSKKLVVECDSFDYHRTRRDRERDATKDADLELVGIRVMRLTWDDVTVHAVRTKRRMEGALR
jgi:very-short-patch-repair endonuclease